MLSTNTSNKDIFDKHKGKYVEVLELSKHKFHLEFLANINKDANKPKRRKRNIIMFKPSFKTSKLTSEFLKIIFTKTLVIPQHIIPSTKSEHQSKLQLC